MTGGRSSEQPPEHSFGGSWTEDKLARVRGYLGAYTTIFTVNERARHFRTTYVDAFAGTGARSPLPTTGVREEAEGSLFEDAEADPEARSFKQGSTRAALEVEPGFDSYVFVDRNPDHADQLRRLGTGFPEKTGRISVEVAEANAFLLARLGTRHTSLGAAHIHAPAHQLLRDAHMQSRL